MTSYRILDAKRRRYLELGGLGTVIPSGPITTTDLRRVGMFDHAGIRTFLIEATQEDAVPHVSDRDPRFRAVEGWQGFTIHRDQADEWDEIKGYGTVRLA